MGSIGNGDKKYTVEYTPARRGQITRYEAGILYKAVKEGNVKTYPELTSQLYDETNDSYILASERYTQNYRYYDRIESITLSLLNNDYKTAQSVIDELQDDLIRRSGKKSKWYKYREGRNYEE